MSPEVRFRLEDMRNYAGEAITLLGGLDTAAIGADRMRELALTRLVEIVGEAAARVPDDERSRLSALPWREAIGLRNILIHGYRQVKTEILVATVRDHFPPLVERLNQILEEQAE